MNTKISKKISYIWFAPIISICIMLVLYAIGGIYPFGPNTTAVSDGVAQYIPFLAEFSEKIKTGGSLLFTWHAGRGVNFWANIAYYLASPLNLIALFFNSGETDKAFALINMLQVAIISLTFSIFLKYQYKKNDISIVIFSLLWAFSSFMIEAMTITAWFYSIIYFPLVVLGLQRLIDGKNGIFYTVFLGLSIVSNFYIGWMTCIFCVIYFIYAFIVDEDVKYEGVSIASNEDGESADSVNIFTIFKNSYLLKSIFKFGGCSLLAGISTAIISLPTAFALDEAGKGTLVSEAVLNIKNIWYFLTSHVIPIENSFAAMANTSVVYSFAGIVTIVLVVAYFFSKGIPVRKKIGNAFLLVIMLVSFVFFAPYFVWHGFGIPMGIMYRFAFIYSFVLLKIAYESYLNRENLNLIGVVLGALFVLTCSVGLKHGGELMDANYSIRLLVAIIVFTVIYALIFLILLKKVKTKQMLSVLIAFCVVAEIIIMYGGRIPTSNLRSNISEITQVEKIKSQIEKGEYLTFNPKQQGFGDIVMYGMEFGFNAVEYYSSMAQFENTYTYQILGSQGNSLNLQNGSVGQTPVFNMVFPTKYALDGKNEYNENWFREKISEEDGYCFYKNNYTMPFMYTVPNSIKEWKPLNYPIPIDAQNATGKAFTDTEDNILTYNKNSDFQYENCEPKSYLDYMREQEEYSDIHDHDSNKDYYQYLSDKMFGVVCSIKKPNTYTAFSFTSTAQEDGLQYIYVDANLLSKITITINGEKKEYVAYGVSDDCTYELGEVKKGDEIKVKFSAQVEDFEGEYIDDNLSAICFTVNKDKFEKAYNKLDSMSDTELLEFEDTYVKAKVTSYEDGILYIPTAYDEGWTITIDGEEVPLYEHESHILMTEITKGEHIVEMKYCPQGFKAGAAITGVSVAILIAWAVISKKRQDKFCAENKANEE